MKRFASSAIATKQLPCGSIATAHTVFISRGETQAEADEATRTEWFAQKPIADGWKAHQIVTVEVPTWNS